MTVGCIIRWMVRSWLLILVIVYVCYIYIPKIQENKSQNLTQKNVTQQKGAQYMHAPCGSITFSKFRPCLGTSSQTYSPPSYLSLFRFISFRFVKVTVIRFLDSRYVSTMNLPRASKRKYDFFFWELVVRSCSFWKGILASCICNGLDKKINPGVTTDDAVFSVCFLVSSLLVVLGLGDDCTYWLYWL